MNWGERLGRPEAVDPYLLWADATAFRWLPIEDPDNVPFLVEVRDVDDFTGALGEQLPAVPPMPGVYLSHARVPKYFTCRVPLGSVRTLVDTKRTGPQQAEQRHPDNGRAIAPAV